MAEPPKSTFVPFGIGCGLLLLLGSRLYVVSFLLMFAIYWSNFSAPFQTQDGSPGNDNIHSSGGIDRSLEGGGKNWKETAVNVVQEPVLTNAFH